MENSQLARHRQALIQTSTASAIIAPKTSLHHLDFYDRVNFPRPPEPADFAKAETIHWAENPLPQNCARLRPSKYPIKVSNASRSFSPSPVIALLFFLRELPPKRRNTLRASEYLTISGQ